MRYCHECGAEVTPEDIFCLHCGIVLQPALSLSGEKEDTVSTGDLPEREQKPSETAQQADSPDLAALITADDSAVINLESASQSETDQPPESLPDSQSDFTPENAPENSSASPKVLEAISEILVDDSNIAAPEDENLLALPEIGESEVEDNDSQALPSSSDSAFTWENLSVSLSKKIPEIHNEPSSEQIGLTSSPPIVKAQEIENADDLAESTILDEDLQPTIISQSSNLLLPIEAEPLLDSALNVSEQPVAFSNEKSSEAIAAPEESEKIADQQNVAALAGSEDWQPTPSQETGIETPDIEQKAVPFVESASSKISGEVAAVVSPRHTESNLPQETPGSKSPKLKPLDPGTLLNNRYKIVRRIGGGGMGAVYLAEDQNLGGVMRAVKEMIQAYVDESQQEKAVADFRRESVLLTQLEHSSIPTIYDYFFDEAKGRFYLVMKYIAGGDLAARLRAAPESKLDEGSVTTWAIQIADVLDYLHNRQPPIVYRDLKPSNIMLDGSNNKAMLIDFGIARWVNKEEKGVTAVGTMGYAPPELFAGNAEPRSDIYSLGATMFHLLTGADPQSNPLLIFDFTKNPRPRQINLMLSVEMEDILLRSVEYNSGLRFDSAERMRDELREHLEKLKAGRLTFERSSHNLAQVMPIPAQAPPSVPFASQPPVNMVFCGFCGEKIIATDMFCAYCGAPQASAPSGGTSQQMQQTIMSPKPLSQSPANNATARLVVLGTNELDVPLFKLEKDNNLVGREDRRANIFPEVDLSKFDNKAQVSRRHARIWREGAAYMIEDLKSSNGTILITDDNQTVRLQANQPHVLQHGDKLKLGETTLRFYVN